MEKPKQIKSLFLILSVLILCSCTRINNNIVGIWKGESKGVKGSLVLDRTNHAILVYNDLHLGGENFITRDGKKVECMYEIDLSKSPIWLDIVIYDRDINEEMKRLKGIVRFLNKNKIEYRVDFNGSRFDDFDSEDTRVTIIFNRVMK